MSLTVYTVQMYYCTNVLLLLFILYKCYVYETQKECFGAKNFLLIAAIAENKIPRNIEKK